MNKGKNNINPNLSSSSSSSTTSADINLSSNDIHNNNCKTLTKNNNPQKNFDEDSSCILIDITASVLNVEPRRIYDVVNILESIDVVSRRRKKTYTWNGTDHLPLVFARLQRHAASLWPHDAHQNQITITDFNINISNNEERQQHMQYLKPHETKNSLSKLTQSFLQIFLVGIKVVSLPFAVRKLSLCDNNNDDTVVDLDDDDAISVNSKRSHSSNTPDLKKDKSKFKTKLRRLYDIANCMSSLGIISKVDPNHSPTTKGDSSTTSNNSTGNGPQSFTWSYHLSPTDLPQVLLLHHPSYSSDNAIATTTHSTSTSTSS